MAEPDTKRDPSDAERTRTLFTHTRHATLATVAVNPAGYPFGSLVTHALDPAGRPVLSLSDMAEHTTNLTADPRASLMVGPAGAPAAELAGSEPAGSGPAGVDPLAGARATLIGDLHEVPEPEREAVHRAYRATHPGAFYSEFADFRLYRLEPRAVRYVGGYGRMSWVPVEEYRAAAADPLVAPARGIIEHMNDDHAEALPLFARVLGGFPDATRARMVAVDRYGFDVLAGRAGSGEARTVRIGFPAPCDTPGAVRSAMIALLQRARADDRP